ncbi:MAG: hypothetical protein RLO81_19590 [Fulvivirga sp.]|uniref:hypothetical protein n=1 Tax=Fulvivirga sp. TaxID=1931237 RepID=UPI0032EEDAB7
MNKSLVLPIVLCLTLGLAPFLPEPHLWGKLKWLLGGAQGMGAMDYFDLVLHGAPWIYLIVLVFRRNKPD